MIWLIALVSAVTTAVVGLIGTGVLANACVSWYRISSFEGKSGFFVVGLALLGGLAGLVLGAVTPFVVASSPRFGGWTSCLVACGIAIATLLIATACCRLLADTPPRIDGRRVIMHVELRLPARTAAHADGQLDPDGPDRDVTPMQEAPPAELDGSAWIALSSNLYGIRESRTYASLREDGARLEDGHWIVPAELWPHTRRGRLSLEVNIGGTPQPSIVAFLPSAPSHEHIAWSEWRAWSDGGATSTDGGLMYRFRVEPEPPPEPVPTTAEIEARRAADRIAAFESLDADGALVDLLPYAVDMADSELRDRALAAIAMRPNLSVELAPVTFDDDAQRAADALRTIARLVERSGEADVDCAPIVAAAGRDLADRIDRFNATSVDDDPHFLGAADASVRFSAWIDAARALRTRQLGDLSAELGAILDRSRRRPESIAMRQDVCRVASYYFSQWTGTPPHPDDPPPKSAP